MTSQMLNLATWIHCTTAEGPGKRFALWVQGCAIRCPGCCNPEMFSNAPKHLKPVDEVLNMILTAKDERDIEGVTILGGEPFSQACPRVALTTQLKQHDLSVMVFTGFQREDLEMRTDGEPELIEQCDILVDGPYIQEQHTQSRRWIGSENQRVHFLTSRYQDTEDWEKPNTVEITFDGKELEISGFPMWQKQIEAWKRVLQKREESQKKS